MLPTILRSRPLAISAFLVLQAISCKGQSPKKSEPSPPVAAATDEVDTHEAAKAPATSQDACSLALRPLQRKATGRVVAIGDIHGDLAAGRRALRLAGAIDEADNWIGGNLSIVQTGDILDRGDDEQELLELLARLEAAAEAAGGAIHRVNGNHELMNAMGDFRYVTRSGFEDFAEGELPEPMTMEARVKAFAPGGPYARRLAAYDMVMVVGSTVFVHGGVLPRFVEDLERANRDSRCFLLGELAEPPEVVVDPEGPQWTRVFSSANPNCELLAETLGKMGVTRMVVGHTPQLGGISSACEERVWRIDTGMAAFYGGPTQVLEIDGDQVRVLK